MISQAISAETNEKSVKMQAAIQQGKKEDLQLLLEEKVNPNIQFNDQTSPIENAIKHDQKDILALLISHRANVNQKDAKGFAPLYRAAEKDRRGMVTILLEAKANLHQRAKNGTTALFISVENGYTPQTELLLQAKANPNHGFYDGWSPVMNAVREGYKNNLQLLINAKANLQLTYNSMSPTFLAAEYNQLEILKMLINAGANISGLAQTDKGSTPLIIASEKGNFDVVKTLLAENADPDLVFNNGSTAIFFALFNHHDEIFNILVEAKADLHLKNITGATLLHYAADIGQLEVIKALLKAGLDIQSKDKNGNTPLHYATTAKKREAVLLLLQSNADPNLENIHRKTPLIFAVEYNQVETVKTMLEYKANPTQWVYGGSLLECARNWNSEIAKMLMDAGASPIPSGQKFFIDHIKSRGIKFDSDGACFGIIGVSTQKFFAGRWSDYLSALEWIACEEQKQYKNKRDQLNPVSSEIPEIIKNVSIYMQARDYLGLFPASVKIQDQDFLQTLFLLDRETFNNIMCAEMFFGIYFRQELNFYFTSLYEAFHNFAGKLVFALNNIGHEMAFYYDPGISRFWGFLNPNTMVVTYLKDENLLSKYVLNGFRSREVAMQLKIYCDRKDQSAVMERIQIWKKSPQWQAIHTINPVKIKMRDTKGTTLLALGAYHNNIELVRQLLTAKANPEIPRYSGANAMLMSAQHGNIPLMQLLNQYGASYEGHVSSNDGSTSLHLAAGMGELDTVAFLLNEKISPNIEKKKGFTPLHMASMNKRLPTMRLLIEHKADVNSVGKKGESVLYQATVYGDVEPMRILLEEKANVNAVTYEGGTALYLAAQEGHLDAVKILIEYGADPQFKFQNRTPLFIAVEKKQVSVVKFLLTKYPEAIKNPEGGYESNLLTVAVQNRDIEIVEVLIAAKISINILNIHNMTPLDIAIEGGYKAIIDLLIENKAESQIKKEMATLSSSRDAFWYKTKVSDAMSDEVNTELLLQIS